MLGQHLHRSDSDSRCSLDRTSLDVALEVTGYTIYNDQQVNGKLRLAVLVVILESYINRGNGERFVEYRNET